MSSFHRFLKHRATVRVSDAGVVGTLHTDEPVLAWAVPPGVEQQLADNRGQQMFVPYRVAVKSTRAMTAEWVFYMTDAPQGIEGKLLAVRFVRPNSDERPGILIGYCDEEFETDRWVPA